MLSRPKVASISVVAPERLVLFVDRQFAGNQLPPWQSGGRPYICRQKRLSRSRQRASPIRGDADDGLVGFNCVRRSSTDRTELDIPEITNTSIWSFPGRLGQAPYIPDVSPPPASGRVGKRSR